MTRPLSNDLRRRVVPQRRWWTAVMTRRGLLHHGRGISRRFGRAPLRRPVHGDQVGQRLASHGQLSGSSESTRRRQALAADRGLSLMPRRCLRWSTRPRT